MKVRDYVDLVLLFLFVFFATHILACIWCYFGRIPYTAEDKDMNWVQYGGFDSNDFTSIYIFSIYFILQTLTTVGYGDHTGSTKYEYIFCMILEVFAYIFIYNIVHRFKFLLFPDGQH